MSRILKSMLATLLCLVFLFDGIPCVDLLVEANGLSPTYSVSDSYASSPFYSKLCSVSLTGNQRTDLINVALSQLGYREGSYYDDLSGIDNGSYNNYCEYNYWYHNYVSSYMPLGGGTRTIQT